jgi:hypothetical protein
MIQYYYVNLFEESDINSQINIKVTPMAGSDRMLPTCCQAAMTERYESQPLLEIRIRDTGDGRLIDS